MKDQNKQTNIKKTAKFLTKFNGLKNQKIAVCIIISFLF